jgi:hypothetical protein
MAGAAAAAWLALTGAAGANVVETRELAEAVPVTAGQPLVVIVKNITGSVRVTEHDLNRVEMQAMETIRGDLQADIERARRELALKTESEPGRVAFRVRGSTTTAATATAAGGATITSSNTTSRCACRAARRSTSRPSMTATSWLKALVATSRWRTSTAPCI